MRRFDDPSSFAFLFFGDLPMQLIHFRPMQLGTIVMLGVESVIEPEEIINLLIGTHSPSDRLVRISPVVEVVTVQIRKTMAKIIEG